MTTLMPTPGTCIITLTAIIIPRRQRGALNPSCR